MFSEDMTPFFNTDDFGVVATFAHGTSTSSVNVLFDSAYADPLGIEGSHPRAAGMASDIGTAVHGDTLAIGTGTYKIVNVRPDGSGVVVLNLQAQ